ncbi:MAG TPA: hypothetical protein ENN88_03775 [Candidatus Coatesbacteria bacterium]|nr:hypothetical protein [Candidatus Coatesbacteria bacterium]
MTATKPILLLCVVMPVLTTVGPVLAAEVIPVIEWEGRLDYAALGYLEKRLTEAAEGGAPILVWRLDSFGGELDAARRIADLLRASPVPVVIWVGPGEAVLGDEALPVGLAAAGLFGSGSARFGLGRPLTLDGGGRLTGLEPSWRSRLDRLGLFAAEEAERSGYNRDWAALLARGWASLSARDLETFNLGGGAADNLNELLQLLDGRRLNHPGETAFATTTWRTKTIPTDVLWDVLSFIVNPNVAFALFLFAMFAFAFTATNPGGYFTPVMGVAFLLVSLLAFNYLPLGWPGLVLVVVSMVLFTLEALLGTKGVLAILSLGALFAGGLTFYRPDTVQVSVVVLVLSLAVTGVFFLFAVGGGLLTKLTARSIGSGELIGESGFAATRFGKRRRGWVSLKSGLWPATALAPLERGRRVRVLGIEGGRLLVEPQPEESSSPEA